MTVVGKSWNRLTLPGKVIFTVVPVLIVVTVVAVMAIGRIGANPVWGSLADARLGRRRVVRLGLGGAVVAGLNALPGVSCVMPQGAFYAFPNITGTGMDARSVADRLLTEAGVAVLAGTAFGQFGEGYLRLSYANSLDNIEEALSAMGDLLATAPV